MPTLKAAPVIGLPQLTGWSQVATNSTANLVCAFSVQGENANNLGRDLSDYLASAQPKSASQLHQLVLDLQAQMRTAQAKLQLAIALVLERQMILATFNGQILLKRGRKIGKILGSGNEFKLVQGPVKTNDVLILATHQAASFLSEIKQKLQQGYDIDTIITNIVPGLHKQENSALSALGFVAQEHQVIDTAATAPKSVSATSTTPPTTTQAQLLEPNQQPLATRNKAENNAPSPSAQTSKPLPSQQRPEPKNQQSTNNLRPLTPTTQTLTPTSQLTSSEQPQPVSPTALAEQLTDQVNKSPTKKPIIKINQQKLQAGLTTSKQIFSKSTGLFKKLTHNSKPVLKNLAAKLASAGKKSIPLLKKLANQLKQLISSLKPSKEIYLNRSVNKKKLRQLAFILILIIVLIAIVLTYQWRNNQQAKAAQQELQPIQTLLEQARSQADQNPLVARDQTKAAIDQLEELRQNWQQSSAVSQLLDQEVAQAMSFLEKISGKEELQELPIYLNLQQLEGNVIADQLDLNEDLLVLLDSEKKQFVQVKLADKTTQVFALDKINTVTDLTLSTNNIYFLGQGIHRFDPSNQNLTTIKTEGDSDRAGQFLANFGPYFYVFNPEKRNLYRYSLQDEELSDPVGWFVSKKDLEFEQITSLAIDGDIWLGTAQGEIKKFSKGSEITDFQITDLAEPFNSAVQLYTKEDLEYLYVLEPAQHRLVSLTKDGQFYQQFKSISLAGATNLAVSETRKQAFCLSGSVVFVIEL
ncbi:MAG: hypothetical protein GF390_03565 [Candidatus Pacebacteria bacterium]|nr:hypothetical protein [Candidatus Paceibacterota bacterium]